MTLRLLANENFHGPVVRELRRRGDDGAWVSELEPGAPDEQALPRARLELRTVVTFDKDFGVLAVRAGLRAACGVVLLRLTCPTAALDNERAIEASTDPVDRAGHFVVIDDDRTRIRPVP